MDKKLSGIKLVHITNSISPVGMVFGNHFRKIGIRDFSIVGTEHAFSTLRDEKPHIVIVDWNADGYASAVSVVRNISETIPVMITLPPSGRVCDHFPKFENVGAVNHVSLYCDSEELHKEIVKTLELGGVSLLIEEESEELELEA